MKEILKAIGYILIVLLLGFGIYSCHSYKLDLYKRKYPGTTTWDYWMDTGRK